MPPKPPTSQTFWFYCFLRIDNEGVLEARCSALSDAPAVLNGRGASTGLQVQLLAQSCCREDVAFYLEEARDLLRDSESSALAFCGRALEVRTYWRGLLHLRSIHAPMTFISSAKAAATASSLARLVRDRSLSSRALAENGARILRQLEGYMKDHQEQYEGR